MTRPPIQLHFSLPPFLRPGDNLELPVELHNASDQGLAVRVLFRAPGTLCSFSGMSGAGDRASMPFPCAAGPPGIFQASLELLCEGFAPDRCEISFPILAGESSEPAPTLADLRSTSGPSWTSPVEEGLRVSRRYETLDGQAFSKGWRGWRLPLGSLVRVSLELAGHPNLAVRLVEPLPAGLGMQEDAPPKCVGLSHQDWRFEVEPGRLMFQADSLPEHGLVFSYTALAGSPGEFLAPPARVGLLECPDVRGRTGWEALDVEPLAAVGDGPGTLEPDAILQWDSTEGARGPSAGELWYWMVVDQRGRSGWTRLDGSVWEHTHDGVWEQRLFGYAWSGFFVPALVLHSHLLAVPYVLDWQAERLLVGPRRRKKKRGHIVVDILPRDIRLREGLARRVRARLRELGCPLPQVQRP